MGETSLASLLKAENIRLKKKVEELEDTILRITGSIRIFASGISSAKTALTDKIDSIINSAEGSLRIVTPKAASGYAEMLIKKGAAGTKIDIVINDRIYLTPEETKKSGFAKLFGKQQEVSGPKTENYAEVYDRLKLAKNINLINNPNVKFLLVMSDKEAVFSAGWLERKILENTVLLGVYIKDPKKLKELDTIYKELLPSFMR